MKDIILLILTFFLSLPVSSQISLEIKDNEGFPIYTSSWDSPVFYDKSTPWFSER